MGRAKGDRSESRAKSTSRFRRDENSLATAIFIEAGKDTVGAVQPVLSPSPPFPGERGNRKTCEVRPKASTYLWDSTLDITMRAELIQGEANELIVWFLDFVIELPGRVEPQAQI